MSGNPNDDQPDDAVDSAWRREFREEPAATTDAVIRAAARRELASRGAQRARHGRLRHWTPFAAAAAVGVLAFGLVRWLPVDHELATVTPSRSTESNEKMPDAARPEAHDSVMPEPTPSEDAAQRPAAPEPQSPPRQPPGPEPAGERRERMTGPSPTSLGSADRVTVQSQRSPSPSPPATVLPQAMPESRDAPKTATTEAAPAATGAEADVSSNAARSDAVAPMARTAERPEKAVSTATRQTVRRIAELHTAGRLGEAAEELRQLRTIETRADDLLPPELRPWAATVTD